MRGLLPVPGVEALAKLCVYVLALSVLEPSEKLPLLVSRKETVPPGPTLLLPAPATVAVSE